MSDMICCPLSSNDGDAATVCNTTYPRAAKEHRCSECRETIAIGAKHELVKALWDGSWSTFRTCTSCVEIRMHFQCGGWLFGELWSDLEQNFFPDMKAGGPCMKGLSPDNKNRLFTRRMKWLGER